MKQRKTKKSEYTQERILIAAEKEFSEKGFYGARVDSIAAESGINKRMIYAHFGSKEGLYAKVLFVVYERLAACERGFMRDDLSPAESIRNIIFVSFKFLIENPSFVRMLLWENLNRGMAIPVKDLVELKAPTFEYMKKQIRLGKESGAFRKEADEDQVVLSLMSFCFSYFSNVHTMSAILGKAMTDEKEVMERADFIANILIKYLSA